VASPGRPRNRPDPGALTAGDSGEAALHHAIKHGPQALIGGPETTGLQQMQGCLLLRLQPQQWGTLEQQQAAGLNEITLKIVEQGNTDERAADLESHL